MSTKQNRIKISIVTPVYNCSKYVESCILSVLNQDYKDLEHIIIDGGSTDGTAQIIERYADELAYFVSEKDRGQTHALNKGFAKATGDVFGWLNADEEYLPGALSKVGQAFLNTPDLDFYYGQRIIVDSEKREIGRKTWAPMHPKWWHLYRMATFPTDASFWSARAHRLTGSLDEDNFLTLCMDFDWFLRLSFKVKKWEWTPECLSIFTDRPDGLANLGSAADPNLGKKIKYLARARVIDHYQYSKVKLFFGWAIAGVWCRIYERRINRPHLLSSLKDLFLLDRSLGNCAGQDVIQKTLRRNP